jgi:hypothetical protein
LLKSRPDLPAVAELNDTHEEGILSVTDESRLRPVSSASSPSNRSETQTDGQRQRQALLRQSADGLRLRQSLFSEGWTGKLRCFSPWRIQTGHEEIKSKPPWPFRG